VITLPPISQALHMIAPHLQRNRTACAGRRVTDAA